MYNKKMNYVIPRRVTCKCCCLSAKTKELRESVLTGGLDFSTKSCGNVLSNCFFSGTSSANRIYSKSKSAADCVCFLKMIVVMTAVVASCSLVTADPLPKIPAFQDAGKAVESTKCAVREEIVDIRGYYPLLPPDAVYSPSCVLLRKCSGCCESDEHECMPTSIYNSTVEIGERRSTFSYINLTFTHHADCACQSPENPICVPQICSKSEVWNKEMCRCDPRCARQECGSKQKWNQETCSCKCQPCKHDRRVHCQIQSESFEQDEVTCLCKVSVHKQRQCRRFAHCAKNLLPLTENKVTCMSKCLLLD